MVGLIAILLAHSCPCVIIIFNDIKLVMRSVERVGRQGLWVLVGGEKTKWIRQKWLSPSTFPSPICYWIPETVEEERINLRPLKGWRTVRRKGYTENTWWQLAGNTDGEAADNTGEWSTLEREKQICHINTYIRDLGREYQWTYLQGRNGDRHRKWTSGHSGGRRE